MISIKKGQKLERASAQVYGRNRPFNRDTKTHLINDFVAFGRAAGMRVPARKRGTKPETARLSRGESVDLCSSPVLAASGMPLLTMERK